MLDHTALLAIQELAFTCIIVNANLLVKSNLYRKRICVLAGNDFDATGVSDALVGMEEAMHPAGNNCFRRRNRQEILATSNGVVVDLPEGGVPLGQLEAAFAEGPDVHQSLDEGEEQCR